MRAQSETLADFQFCILYSLVRRRGKNPNPPHTHCCFNINLWLSCRSTPLPEPGRAGGRRWIFHSPCIDPLGVGFEPPGGDAARVLQQEHCVVNDWIRYEALRVVVIPPPDGEGAAQGAVGLLGFKTRTLKPLWKWTGDGNLREQADLDS